MKIGRRGGRPPRRRDALALLASARPAALDADPATRSHWPGADQLISAAGQAGRGAYRSAGSRDDAGSDGASGWRLAASGRRKVIGALSSGAVTAAVVGIAALVGTTVLASWHPRSPGAPPPAVGAFRALPLRGDWHGRLAVAVDDGVVYLAGQAGSTGDHSSVLATLPPGLRPAAEIDLVVSLGKAGDGSVRILPDGSIVPVSPHANFSLVSLSGLSFPLGC